MAVKIVWRQSVMRWPMTCKRNPCYKPSCQNTCRAFWQLMRCQRNQRYKLSCQNSFKWMVPGILTANGMSTKSVLQAKLSKSLQEVTIFKRNWQFFKPKRYQRVLSVKITRKFFYLVVKMYYFIANIFWAFL